VLSKREIGGSEGAMRARAILIMVVLLVAGACTFGRDQRGGSRQADGPPVRGGTLRAAVPDSRVGEFQDLGALDPQRAYTGLAWELFRCCLLRTLYSYNGKETDEGGGVLRPDLAVGGPEVSNDGLTWTFRLRPGLRFAPPFEDRPITALDVVRALERTAKVTSPTEGYGFYYEVIRGFEAYGSGAADSIAGLETPDEWTLVVRLDRVTSDLAYRFSLPATAPIPEGAADGHEKDYMRFLVASGPYMLEGSERLDFGFPPDRQRPAAGFVPPVLTKGAVKEPGSLVLVRNPSWNLATDRLRAAYPDRIELTIGGLEDKEIARRVDTAKMDLVFDTSSPFEQVARYREDPERSGRVFVDQMDTFLAVNMNVAAPPFDDVHVRRAVAYAIDKAALVEILSRPPHLPLGHTAEIATHIAPDSLEGSLLRAFDPYPHDPEAARAEMRASAYDRTGDGRCDAPACQNVRAIVLDVGVIPEQARAIRKDLAEVGIVLALESQPLHRYFSLLQDLGERIPMGIPSPWVKDYPEGAGWFLGLFDSSALGVSGSPVGASPAQLRKWGYSVSSVPSVDDRIQACLGRRGVATIECWAELDQYLMTQVVSWLPYMSLDHAQVVSERVVGYSFDQFDALPALDRIALAPGSD
jgi:peptide/nickel transport system substrate-binding protein